MKAKFTLIESLLYTTEQFGTGTGPLAKYVCAKHAANLNLSHLFPACFIGLNVP